MLRCPGPSPQPRCRRLPPTAHSAPPTSLPLCLSLPPPLPSPQVVLTSIEPRGRPELQFDAYEYTVQSHQYTAGAP